METFREAMTAQAMTVFPAPGGANKTPSSCSNIASTATCCCGIKSASECEVAGTRIRTFICISNVPPPFRDSDSTEGSTTPGQNQTVRMDLTTENEPWDVVGAETQPLFLGENRIRQGGQPLERRNEAGRKTVNADFKLGMTNRHHAAREDSLRHRGRNHIKHTVLESGDEIESYIRAPAWMQAPDPAIPPAAPG